MWKTRTCWYWTGARRPNGYGQIQEAGKGSRTLSAHKVSYQLHHGEVPEGMVVMHTCDTPGCVNPSHLRVGTYKENMDDMRGKGRAKPGRPLGERNFNAKLDAEKVRYIRANPHKMHTELAAELGVKPNAVRGVRTGRTWTHVT